MFTFIIDKRCVIVLQHVMIDSHLGKIIKISQDCVLSHRISQEIRYLYNIVRLAEKSNELEWLGAVVTPS
jgi:hypothetical protein